MKIIQKSVKKDECAPEYGDDKSSHLKKENYNTLNRAWTLPLAAVLAVCLLIAFWRSILILTLAAAALYMLWKFRKSIWAMICKSTEKERRFPSENVNSGMKKNQKRITAVDSPRIEQGSGYGKIRQQRRETETTIITKGSNNMMKTAYVFCSLLLIAAFAAIYFLMPQSEGNTTYIAKTPAPATGRALNSEIDAITDNCNSDCEKMLAEFMNALEEKISPDFAKADQAVPGVVKELSSTDVCLKLTCKAVKDKIKGTNDFRDAYIGVMQDPVIQPCLQADATAFDMLEALELRIKERHSQYAMELASACKDESCAMTRPEEDIKRLEACIESFAKRTEENSFKNTWAVIGGAMEVIFIREAYTAIIKLFVKPVTKICSSLGAAGICAAADGPLPLGDIIGGGITIGGLGLTIYDIYDITRIMPKKLTSELRMGIASTKATLLDDYKTQAQKLLERYNESAESVNRTLKEQLK